MNLGFSLHQVQAQKQLQILSPRMIQTLKTFQLPYQELLETVQTESEENVMIDVISPDQLQDRYSRSQSSESGSIWDTVKDRETLKQALIRQINFQHLSQSDEGIALRLIDQINDKGF